MYRQQTQTPVAGDSEQLLDGFMFQQRNIAVENQDCGMFADVIRELHDGMASAQSLFLLDPYGIEMRQA